MQPRPRSNSGSGLQPTRSSPRTPTMSSVAVESLLSSIDQMEQLDPKPQSGPPVSSSASSSASTAAVSSSTSSSPVKQEASQSVGTQLLTLVASMQQSVEAANRRSDEATRRADEAIELMKQLLASESKAVQGANQGILSIAKSETQQLQHLNNPTVTSLPPQNRLAPSQHPLLFLPPRLLHPSPVDNPSSAESLLNAFLLERRSGDLVHKKIKTFDDWMRGMEDGMKQAIAAGNLDAVQQSIKYITLMSDFNSTYGWTAADCYWYELQKEVHAGYHSLLSGSPWNARSFSTMTSKYQPLSGRPKQSASTSSTSSSSSSPSSSSATRRPRNLECEHHGKDSSHTTADCMFLASQKSSNTAKSS